MQSVLFDLRYFKTDLRYANPAVQFKVPAQTSAILTNGKLPGLDLCISVNAEVRMIA